MPMFGSRVLPPPADLPARVRDAVAAREDSQRKLSEAQAELGNHERVGLPMARQNDIEEHARASEEGKPAPKRGQHEERAVRKLDELQRSVEANSLVLKRATERVDERIAEHRDAINHAAQKRLGDARKDFLRAVDDLDAATAELAMAQALVAWVGDTTLPFKLRAGPTLPSLTSPAGDALGIGTVIAALRSIFEPRPAHRIPSPFGVATELLPQPTPDAPTPAEAQPGHSFEAELTAGRVANVDDD
jgi:hypothetical protein